MSRVLSRMVWGAMFAVILVGCATTSSTPPDAIINRAERPAWTLSMSQKSFEVAASPTRKTLQFAGTTGFLLGTGVDAVVNARIRRTIDEALEGYDPSAVYTARLESMVHEAFGGKIEKVNALEARPGQDDYKARVKAYYAGLADKGIDRVLNLRPRYGLYGTEMELVAEIDADVVDASSGRPVWEALISVNPRPALASDKLGDPVKLTRSTESAPRFVADEAALARWTSDKGATLKREYERAIEGATAAVLDALGVQATGVGAYFLGREEMNRKNFDVAERHFRRAVELEPALLDAKNALAVILAHSGKIEDAIAVATTLSQSAPEYGPAWFNLAWWYAVEKNDLARAKSYYESAVRLGFSSPKLDGMLK